MAIPNSTPVKWSPKGLTDASDGTNSFPGAMQQLVNLIPDPSTAGIFVPRPAAQQITDFTGTNAPTGPGIVSALLTVGDLEYGMIESTLNAGKDEPFCYDLANDVFLPVSGITNANTPLTQPSSGDWVPPIVAQVAGRVIVCHPGFPGGTIKFGWFDVSGFTEVTLGNTHSSTLIDGNPSVLGVQPGMSITGIGIPANTSVAGTTQFVLTTAGDIIDSHIENVQVSTGVAVGQDVGGFGIAAGTTVTILSFIPHATTGNTHSSTVLDQIVPIQGFTIAYGQTIIGSGIQAGTFVESISNILIDGLADLTSGSATITVSDPTGIVADMTVTGFGIAPGTLVVTNTAFRLDTVGDFSTGSAIITNLGSTTGLVPGMMISVGFPFTPGIVIATVDSPTQITASNAIGQTTVAAAAVTFTGGSIVLDTPATATVSFSAIHFGSVQVIMSLPATSSLVATTITFSTLTVTLSQASLLAALTHIDVTFSGGTITLSQAATATNNNISLTIAGGTRAAPQWGAGDCDRNPLPSVPLGVAEFNGRAYFADGLEGIPFSDSGFPCRRSNQPNVQALTTNDGTAVTVIAPLELSAPLTGGIVQALIAFSADGAMRQITGDPATNNLAMNLLPIATGTLAPLSVIPCVLGTAFVSPQGLRFVRPDGSVTDPIGFDGQGVTHPMQYAKFPSRICAEANVQVLRISLQHGSDPGEPFQEFWFDLSRKTWSGPHSFPARLIQHWRKTFVMAPLAKDATLWVSDTTGPHYGGGTEADFIENGVQMSWIDETVLLPDNEQMSMNAMVEANLTCSAAPNDIIQVVVNDEQGSAINAVNVIPTVLNYLLRERVLAWTEPVVFKQMSIQARGTSNSRVRVGNLYMRYEILGYSNDDVSVGGGSAVATLYLRVVPLTGDTLFAPQGLQAFRIDPLGELAALAVVMPPLPNEGDVFCVSTTETIDNLTVTAPGGATMAGTSGGGTDYTLGANGVKCWQYDLALNEWFPA